MKRSGPCRRHPKYSQVAGFVVCVLISISLAGQSTATKAHDDAYVIRVDDVLAINVWKQPEVSRTVPVRSDGRISLPLAGEVHASGETPYQLEKELSTKLQSFISGPEVTVIVTEAKGEKFPVPGQVVHPGWSPTKDAPTGLPGTPPKDLPLLLPWRSLHG
jgi:protein involved in polysaccharide export with SLBB domain